MTLCWFAKFTDTPCLMRPDGNYDPAHLIPQQRLIKEFKSRGYLPGAIEYAVGDKRIIRPACRRHHHAFDISKTIRLLESDYPPECREWANEYGFAFVDPGRGWVAVREAAA